MKVKRKGFTIVELLVVIGIISVLITITVSAVSGSMKRARAQKARALCTLVEQGIATYYAQQEEWPISLDGKVDNDAEVYTLSAADVRNVMLKLVDQTRKGKPVMDVSGLYVSKSSGEASGSGSRGTGMDFLSAVRGTKKNPEGISVREMYFGYPDVGSGHFRRFRMTYSPSADKVTVTRQGEE